MLGRRIGSGDDLNVQVQISLIVGDKLPQTGRHGPIETLCLAFRLRVPWSRPGLVYVEIFT